ncbi:MAG: DUF2834 domain-containing protein [Porticoccaceae bacterium]|nr:DUF2834 domain-containing protein [Porticoccaceae bacterium]
MSCQTIKHGIFLILGVAALILAWPHAFDWIAAGGNILNPIEFFIDPIAAGGASAFLSIDLLVMWLVFMIWVVFDAERIGLGKKKGWGFLALSFIGVSFAFPVYLIIRERFLRSKANSAE